MSLVHTAMQHMQTEPPPSDLVPSMSPLIRQGEGLVKTRAI